MLSKWLEVLLRGGSLQYSEPQRVLLDECSISDLCHSHFLLRFFLEMPMERMRSCQLTSPSGEAPPRPIPEECVWSLAVPWNAGPSWGAELPHWQPSVPGLRRDFRDRQSEDVVESLQNTDKHEHKNHSR